MHVPRSLFAALFLGAVGASSALADPPKPANGAPPAAPAASNRALNDKEKAEAIALFRNYLQDEHADRTRHRLDLRAGLERWKTAGGDLLADLDGLSEVLYRARPFAPVYDNKMFRSVDKNAKFHRDEVNRIVSVSGKTHAESPDPLRLSFSFPASYPTDPKKLNAGSPYPTIVLLHDLADFKEGATSKEHPGAEAIRRLYPRQGPQKAVLDEWLVFAPVASDAKFGEQVGRRVTVPFSDFWKRYHVDFDRVVLDGGEHVITVAAAMPVFFSAVVVRGDRAVVDPAIVPNLGKLPIYVVGSEGSPAVKALREGGAQPEFGDAAGLVAWLKTARGKKRPTPTEFTWNVKDPDLHRLAHWINVNSPMPGAELKVKVDRDANTITIDAKGIEDLSLFLNDRIVDLSKPVKIVANGKETGPPKTFERKLDTMFEADRITIRRSGYYGWLYPVVIEALPLPAPPSTEPVAVEGPKKDGESATTPPGGQNDEAAKPYFDRALAAEKDGDLKRALALYQKVVGVGDSSFKSRAEAKVTEIQAKLAEAPKPGTAVK